MGRTLRGLWLEVRVIPVLLWSFSALTLGTGLGADRGGELHAWYYLGAITLGVLIQGLLAHTVNEIEDWNSGTDRDPSPRMLSGGSKVIVNGLLSPRALRLVFLTALAATVVLGLAMVASRGIVMLPFGLIGVVGAIIYTLPPVRAAYRPLFGEAIAFVCMGACVVGAAILQTPGVGRATWLAAGAVAAYTVSMLMVHHYLDHDADSAARPRKVTSIVWLGLERGRRYAIGWCVSGSWPRWLPRRSSRGCCRSSPATGSACWPICAVTRATSSRSRRTRWRSSSAASARRSYRRR